MEEHTAPSFILGRTRMPFKKNKKHPASLHRQSSDARETNNKTRALTGLGPLPIAQTPCGRPPRTEPHDRDNIPRFGTTSLALACHARGERRERESERGKDTESRREKQKKSLWLQDLPLATGGPFLPPPVLRPHTRRVRVSSSREGRENPSHLSSPRTPPSPQQPAALTHSFLDSVRGVPGPKRTKRTSLSPGEPHTRELPAAT